MSISDAQNILKSKNKYSGKVDGLIGPKSLAGATSILSNEKGSFSSFSDERKIFAAAQALLNAAGFEAGYTDGYWGHNTQNAYDDWERAHTGKPALDLDRDAPAASASSKTVFPRQRDIVSFYGAAGSAAATAGKVQLPISFVIAWNTDQKVSRFSCHKLIAPTFQKVFEEAVAHYGESEYRRLRLDQFGGCYNNRKMRGGKSKSTHAYGVAVDLDPTNNQLRWNNRQASFARTEFIPFWNIVEAHGLVSLGRARDFDWMHFQGVRL
tara:strand:- start:12013 stop:12813 length:801 start_codon:yes stop_codon:yes gene_type:complete